MSNPSYKDPDVNKLFGFDWADYLTGALTIAASAWTLPAGLTNEDDSFTTTTTRIDISGGVDGQDYEILNRITDSNGQTEERTMVIQVREASWRLSETEKVTVAEIMMETYESVDSWSDNLNANQVASIRADLTTWASIRDSHVKMKGGSQGIDFDNERKREAIRRRIRKAYGLSLVPAEVSGYSVSVPHTWIY